MADKKISALTSASTPLAGTEVLPIVQSSATVKVSVANLTAGRAIGVTSIQFNSGTVLSTYEEGTWTPAFISSGATFAYAEQYGSYVKVGTLVTLQMRLRTSSVTGTLTNGINVTGMPFASANLNTNNASGGAMGLCDLVGGLTISIGNNEATYINVWNIGALTNPTAAAISGKYFIATISYRTA